MTESSDTAGAARPTRGCARAGRRRPGSAARPGRSRWSASSLTTSASSVSEISSRRMSRAVSGRAQLVGGVGGEVALGGERLRHVVGPAGHDLRDACRSRRCRSAPASSRASPAANRLARSTSSCEDRSTCARVPRRREVAREHRRGRPTPSMTAAKRATPAVGSAVSQALEGTRPLRHGPPRRRRSRARRRRARRRRPPRRGPSGRAAGARSVGLAAARSGSRRRGRWRCTAARSRRRRASGAAPRCACRGSSSSRTTRCPRSRASAAPGRRPCPARARAPAAGRTPWP